MSTARSPRSRRSESSRYGACPRIRITDGKPRLRVLPGVYDLRVAHIIDGPRPIPPAPALWVSGQATLPDGRVVAADLEYIPVDVHRDVALRVTMVPARD